MAYRALELVIQRAQNLRNVHKAPHLRKMKPFALVSILDNNNNPDSLCPEQETPIDQEGNTNPTWNSHVTINIDITRAVENQLALVIKLKSRRNSGDRDVGEVRVRITELEGFGDANDVAERRLTKNVVNLNGTSQQGEGTLTFSYRFGNTVQHPPAPTVNTGNYARPNVLPRPGAVKRLVKKVTDELGAAIAGMVATAVLGAVFPPSGAESSDQPDVEPDGTEPSATNDGVGPGDANDEGTY